MAKVLTDISIGNLKPSGARREIPDKQARGLYVVVQRSGVKSFAVRYRLRGKPQKLTLGRWVDPEMRGNPENADPAVGTPISLAEARKLAADVWVQVGRGRDPSAEKRARSDSLTVAEMLDQFVERYCRKEAKLKSADQYADTFDRLVKPDIGDLLVFGEDRVRRSHIVDMLDEIEDESGPVMADRTLAYLRKGFNWFAARNEEFTNPIVKGLRKISTNSRDRILNDDELRDLWAALKTVQDVPVCYPRFIKMLLLTTTRRNEAAFIHSSEVDGNDWTIPADRYKTKLDHLIPLSEAARELIGEKPKGARGNSWFVLSTTEGTKGFSGFSKAKCELDKEIDKIRKREKRDPMPHWVLHDLRRTGRSLMSRVGVPSDHAERCLGHVIGGVRGVYDRYEYLDEKKHAFEALAQQIDRIVNGQSAKVVQLRA